MSVPEDKAWFWEIVDRDGLGDVPSDETGALRILVRKAAERDALVRANDRAYGRAADAITPPTPSNDRVEAAWRGYCAASGCMPGLGHIFRAGWEGAVLTLAQTPSKNRVKAACRAYREYLHTWSADGECDEEDCMAEALKAADVLVQRHDGDRVEAASRAYAHAWNRGVEYEEDCMAEALTAADAFVARPGKDRIDAACRAFVEYWPIAPVESHSLRIAISCAIATADALLPPADTSPSRCLACNGKGIRKIGICYREDCDEVITEECPACKGTGEIAPAPNDNLRRVYMERKAIKAEIDATVEGWLLKRAEAAEKEVERQREVISEKQRLLNEERREVEMYRDMAENNYVKLEAAEKERDDRIEAAQTWVEAFHEQSARAEAAEKERDEWRAKYKAIARDADELCERWKAAHKVELDASESCLAQTREELRRAQEALRRARDRLLWIADNDTDGKGYIRDRARAYADEVAVALFDYEPEDQEP